MLRKLLVPIHVCVKKAVLISLPILCIIVISIVFLSCQQITIPSEPTISTQPKQPTSGPGGSSYSHGASRATTYGLGKNRYWIFEPASPTPVSAPVVVLNHGWSGTDPGNLGAWIHHIVRKGNILIFPRYQTLITLPNQMTDNAIDAVKDAIFQLQSGGHVTPQMDKFAIIGYSMGGVVAANMASRCVSEGLPEPKALLVLAPARNEEGTILNALTDRLDLIPGGALMLVVVGSEDFIVKDFCAKEIFYGATSIPLENKDFVTMISDYHGEPPLIADHTVPTGADYRYSLEETRAEVLIEGDSDPAVHNLSSMDYYGHWKLFDGLTNAAFYGRDREYAIGNTPEQRFMGKWSDGTPVEELRITKNP